jgi:16S rRNA A1518/A1519 N6-dimethyltransferase RsmA/KsgA/DIM1 with predicted DNA glycosylase/AP lyase activity
MRTLDSIAAHAPAFIIEWFDDDDMLVQAALLDEFTAARYVRMLARNPDDVVLEVGGATYVLMKQVAGANDDEAVGNR